MRKYSTDFAFHPFSETANNVITYDRLSLTAWLKVREELSRNDNEAEHKITLLASISREKST